jgi:spermidine synthase
MEKILILGVAGGSVIRLLSDEINFKGKIIGVEIDQKVIEIANTYFKLNEIANAQIIIDDAFDFVLKSKDSYNLIVIDVFQDSKMPSFLFEKHFINRVCTLLAPKSYILFNTMVINNAQKQINLDFLQNFDPSLFSVQKLSGIDSTNELFLIENHL